MTPVACPFCRVVPSVKVIRFVDVHVCSGRVECLTDSCPANPSIDSKPSRDVAMAVHITAAILRWNTALAWIQVAVVPHLGAVS